MRVPAALGVGVLIAAAGVLGFFAFGWLGTGLEHTSTVQREDSVAAPKKLPALQLPDLAGKPRDLSEWAGRPLLINFWATWCEPCRREIPLLRQLRAEHAKDQLEIIGIAVDFRDDVAAYAARAGIDYPILIAEQQAMALPTFGVGMGLPTTLFVDRGGRIVATEVGELRKGRAAELLAKMLNTR